MPRRTARAGLLLCALLVASGMLLPHTAHAHADLVAADPPTQSILPSAPTDMRFWFTEPLERFEIVVVNAQQQRVDLNDARIVAETGQLVVVSLQPSLPDGLYRATWEVLSPVDGHVTRGTIPFFIGDPSDLPGGALVEASSTGSSGGALGAIARGLAIGGGLVAGGSTWWVLLMHRRAIALLRHDPAVLDELSTAQRARAVQEISRDSMERLLRIASVAAVALILGLTLQMLVESDLARYSPLDWMMTERGRLWLGRVFFACALLAGLLWMTGHSRSLARDAARGKRPPMPGEHQGWIALAALGGGLFVVSAMGSHAAGLDPVALAGGTSDFIHLAAAAVWIGGLVQFRWSLIPALAPISGPARNRFLARLIRRFSLIAGAAVVVVSVSGTYQLVRLLGEPQVLRQEAWGMLLVLKIVLVLIVLPMAAFNLLRVRPTLSRLAGRLDIASREHAARLRTQFRRAVTGEAVTLIVIVAVVGLMVGAAPGVTTTARGYVPAGWFSPITRAGTENGVEARLTLSPGTSGVNRYDVILTTGGEVPQRGTEVILEFRSLATGETVSLPLSSTAPTLYSTWGREFEDPGEWEVSVIVNGQDQPETRFAFQVSVPEAPPAPDGPAG